MYCNQYPQHVISYATAYSIRLVTHFGSACLALRASFLIKKCKRDHLVMMLYLGVRHK